MKQAKTCSVCGSDAGKWEQHWNRDKGYGLCRSCADWHGRIGTPPAEAYRLYGLPGENYKPLPYEFQGLKFNLIAEFRDNDRGTREANDYMEVVKGSCVLEVKGGKIILAMKTDKGV